MGSSGLDKAVQSLCTYVKNILKSKNIMARLSRKEPLSINTYLGTNITSETPFIDHSDYILELQYINKI